MIFFIPVNFPSTSVLDNYGLRVGIALGMGLTTLGIWFRCLMGHSIFYAVAGQTIMALGQPFLYNAPPKISALWFPEEERLIATSIGAYANIFGVAVGCFIPSVFFDDTDVYNPDTAKSHFFKMNLTLSILCTAVLIPSVIYIRNRTEIKAEEQESVLNAMKQLCRNKNFLLVAISHGLAITYFYIFTTLIAQMIGAYGYSQTNASYLSTAYQIAGIISGVLCSAYLAKAGSDSFRRTSLILIVATMGSKTFISNYI